MARHASSTGATIKRGANGQVRPPCTVGCVQPPFWWRCNRGVITAGIHGNGDNACPDDEARGAEGRKGRGPPKRRSGETPRVTMQKLTYAFTYVSCVRANTDLEGEPWERDRPVSDWLKHVHRMLEVGSTSGESI